MYTLSDDMNSVVAQDYSNSDCTTAWNNLDTITLNSCINVGQGYYAYYSETLPNFSLEYEKLEEIDYGYGISCPVDDTILYYGLYSDICLGNCGQGGQNCEIDCINSTSANFTYAKMDEFDYEFLEECPDTPLFYDIQSSNCNQQITCYERSSTSFGDDDGLSDGTVAGISIGVTCAVIAIVGIIYFFVLRRQRTFSKDNNDIKNNLI